MLRAASSLTPRLPLAFAMQGIALRYAAHRRQVEESSRFTPGLFPVRHASYDLLPGCTSACSTVMYILCECFRAPSYFQRASITQSSASWRTSRTGGRMRGRAGGRRRSGGPGCAEHVRAAGWQIEGWWIGWFRAAVREQTCFREGCRCLKCHKSMASCTAQPAQNVCLAHPKHLRLLPSRCQTAGRFG